MKAFIVLALVACAAARVVDIDTLRLLSKEKSLLKEDMLLKDRLTTPNRWGLHKKTLLNSFDYPSSYYPSTYPSTYTYGDDVESWVQRPVTLLSLEELVSNELFRHYLRIPLFVQFYEQYPTIFRHYVESPLFQRFWTVPQFQQYFRNPIFFYKYIVPQLQVIAQRLPYHTEGIYNRYPRSGLNYDVSDLTRGVERREITVEDYLNKILGHGQTSRFSPYYPYAYQPYSGEYSGEYTTPYPFFGNRVHHQGQGINNYKFLLDRIYKTLFVNHPTVGEVTQVRTDVEVAPARKEIVVEPVTGESKVVYEPTQIVDVKVDEKIVPRTETIVDVERNHVVKEALLKRLLITKHITPELYTILKTLPLHHVKEIVRRIVSPSVLVDYESIFGDDVTFPRRHGEDYIFPTRHFGGEELFNGVEDSVYPYRHRINEILGQLYNKDIVGDRYTPVVRDLLKVLGHRNVVRDVVPSIDEVIRRV